MYIQVIRQTSEESREQFNFNLIDAVLVFVSWYAETRPAGKRKWTVIKWWDQYRKRESTATEPELRMDVREEAHQLLMKEIKVKTWKEYKPNYS